MPAKGTLVTPEQEIAEQADNRAASALRALATLLADMAMVTDIAAAGALFVRAIVAETRSRRAVLMIEDLEVLAEARLDDLGEMYDETGHLPARALPFHLLHEVVETRAPAHIDVVGQLRIAGGNYLFPDGVTEAACVPLIARAELVGLLYVELASQSDVESRSTREFLKFASTQSAAVIGLLVTSAKVAKQDRHIDGLLGEIAAFKDASCRLGSLARGGAWQWDLDTGAMTASNELRSALGMPGERTGGNFALWDWNIGQTDTPAHVLNATELGEAFEAKLEIIRPGDEIVTSLIVFGEPRHPSSRTYSGFAFDIGPLIKKCVATQATSYVSEEIHAVWSRLANPLSSIMVDASAARLWLNRTEPELSIVDLNLKSIKAQVTHISKIMDEVWPPYVG